MKKLMMALAAALTCLALLVSAALAADGWEDHLLLYERGLGTCRELTGTVDMVAVFVSLPDAPWDDAAVARMCRTLQSAADTLSQEAAAFGVQLTMVQHVHHAQAASTVSMDDSEDWVEAIFASAPTLPPRTSDDYHGCPVVFCLNTAGRAFAQSEYGNTQAEYAIFFNDDDAATVRHELLHLYGACDYYMLQALAEAAEAYYPDSIMLAAVAANSTDSLTAYIIGWTDTLDGQAIRFLEATDHITWEMYLDANEAGTITGWGTSLTENGEYDGMLQDGIFHGWGEMRWNDGSTYAGHWAWGTRTGKGVLTWPDGSSYTGDFVDGQRTGTGVYTWPGGSVYTGGFMDGQRTGKGVLTWADGSSYTGDFLNGLQHGYGIYRGTDGTVMDGQWHEGRFLP